MARGTAVLAFLAVCAAVWLFLVQFTQEIDSIRYIEWETAALVGADGRSVSFYGELTPQLAARGEELIQLVIPAVWFVDEAGNRWESNLLDWPVSEEYWPEFRLAEQMEGEIVAIEVNEVYFNIVRTDQPQDSPQRQYMPDYNDLGWVIDLT